MSTEIKSCEDALRLLAAYLDGEMETGPDDALEHHLATCRSCYSRAEFERRLKAQLAGLGREPVHAGLSARIQTLIQKFDVTGAG